MKINRLSLHRLSYFLLINLIQQQNLGCKGFSYDSSIECFQVFYCILNIRLCRAIGNTYSGIGYGNRLPSEFFNICFCECIKWLFHYAFLQSTSILLISLSASQSLSVSIISVNIADISGRLISSSTCLSAFIVSLFALICSR